MDVLGRHLGARTGRRQRHRKRHEEQRGRRRVAAVHLVAHQQRLALDRFQVDAAALVERLAHAGLEHRGQHGLEPFEALQHVGPVGAEAQTPTDALVDVGVGQSAVGRIAHLDQRHRRADDARHRPDGVEVVALAELDLAGLEHAARLLRRAGPVFIQHRADHRALHRAAHLAPGHRRAGVQQQARAAHLGPHAVGAQCDVFPHRPRRDDALGCQGVCRCNARIAHQAGELPRERGVAIAGRAPSHLAQAAAVRGDAVIERGDAQVQHRRCLGQQGVGGQIHGAGRSELGSGVVFSASSRPASRSAPEVAPMRSTPCAEATMSLRCPSWSAARQTCSAR